MNLRSAKREEERLLADVYAMAEVRGITLPSDLLAVARAKNPGLDINLERVEGGWVELRVKTARGVVSYQPGITERWADVFRRSGLLRGVVGRGDSDRRL